MLLVLKVNLRYVPITKVLLATFLVDTGAYAGLHWLGFEQLSLNRSLCFAVLLAIILDVRIFPEFIQLSSSNKNSLII